MVKKLMLVATLLIVGLASAASKELNPSEMSYSSIMKEPWEDDMYIKIGYLWDNWSPAQQHKIVNRMKSQGELSEAAANMILAGQNQPIVDYFSAVKTPPSSPNAIRVAQERLNRSWNDWSNNQKRKALLWLSRFGLVSEDEPLNQIPLLQIGG